MVEIPQNKEEKNIGYSGSSLAQEIEQKRMKKLISIVMIVISVSLVVIGYNQISNRYNSAFAAITTFYPSVYPGSPLDGTVGRAISCASGNGESLTTLRDSAGNQAATNNDPGGGYFVKMRSATDEGTYCQNFVSVVCFDTSSIPDTVSVDSVVYDVWALGEGYVNSGAINYRIVSVTTPTDTTNLAVSDYAKVNYNTPLSGLYAMSDFLTAGWKSHTLTDTSTVNKTGITCFGAVAEGVRTGIVETAWSANSSSEIFNYYAETGSNIPKLTVNYTDGGEPTPTPTPTPTSDSTLKQQILNKIDHIQIELLDLKTLVNQLP